MTARSLASGTLAGLVLAVAFAGPASAQFRWPWESAPAEESAPANAPAPVPPPAGAVVATPAGLPQLMRVLPPKRPSSQAAATTPAPAAEPLPVATAAVTAPAAPAAAAPVPAAPLTNQAIVERANAYFNGIGSLVADFVQVGGDGRRITGKLYLQRPGKLRFDYDPPSPLEVIADGSSVAVRDRKLATQDIYPISQTPLKFLVRDRIELGRDAKITGVSRDPDGVHISLEDSSTLGGTSRITLYFDPAVTALTEWRIVDPQGFQTDVALSNLDTSRRVDNRLFVINYQRILNDGNR